MELYIKPIKNIYIYIYIYIYIGNGWEYSTYMLQAGAFLAGFFCLHALFITNVFLDVFIFNNALFGCCYCETLFIIKKARLRGSLKKRLTKCMGLDINK